MAGEKGNTIGQVSEAAVGLAMARVAREAGMTIDAEFDVDHYQGIINTIDYTNHAVVKARNYGDTLGCQIIQEMLKRSVDKGIDLTTVNFAFYNAATEDVHGAKTEDVIVRIRTEDDEYQEKQRYSVKCKTSSGGVIFGNGSGNNLIFIEKLVGSHIHRGELTSPVQTDLLEKYPEIMDIASDKEFQDCKVQLGRLTVEDACPNEYVLSQPTFLKNPKPAETWEDQMGKDGKLKLDAASRYVDRMFGFDGGKFGTKERNNKTWKTESTKRLVDAMNFIFNLPEFEEKYRSSIQQNILHIAGIKTKTHLACALAEKEDSPTVHFYNSLNCPIYKKMGENKFKKLSVVYKEDSTNFKILLDKTPIGSDLGPGTRTLVVDPLTTFNIK